MSDVKTIKVTVDGQELEVPAGVTALQACEMAGKEIPRFCYHERLSIAGNCRMCLVEVEKSPKPVASCAFPVMDGMKIMTDSPLVRQSRRNVMEFLLINHPLDCPICDQGGECDLQDQAVAYGMDHSRYREAKRTVKDKYVGPLIKTIMNRCILCSRCVRFSAEVAGVSELGATGRGETMEIGTYIEKALTTELAGNLIDVCPVGALTSRPYAYASRPWELSHADSVDVMDAVGANIRVDFRGPDILRILPRINDDVNEEWLGDRSRFSHDAVKRKRLDRPWVKRDGRLKPASWEEAFEVIAGRLRGLQGERIGAVVGDTVDAEAMLALRDLMGTLGSRNVDCRQDGAALDASNRAFYTFNPGIRGIDQADAIVIIGSNPRVEAPVLNARIRRRWSNTTALSVGYVGPAGVDLTYPAEHLGEGPDSLATLEQGDGAFARLLRESKNPLVLLGRGALARPDGAAVLAAAWALAGRLGALREDWNGFAMLHQFGGQVGALDLGLVPGEGAKDLGAMLNGGVDALWLLDADGFDPALISDGTFVIYQGHHGDRAASRADVILPGATYLEKDGTYVNTEGRVQRGRRSVFPPAEAREDWRILRAFSQVLGRPLPYNDEEGIRAALAAANPVFGQVGVLTTTAVPASGPAAGGASVAGGAFALPIEDYYRVDAMTRASEVMAECSRARREDVPAQPAAAE